MLASIADRLTDPKPALSPTRQRLAWRHRRRHFCRNQSAAKCGIQTQIDELLAKRFQPSGTFHHDIAPRFSDGP